MGHATYRSMKPHYHGGIIVSINQTTLCCWVGSRNRETVDVKRNREAGGSGEKKRAGGRGKRGRSAFLILKNRPSLTLTKTARTLKGRKYKGDVNNRPVEVTLIGGLAL